MPCTERDGEREKKQHFFFGRERISRRRCLGSLFAGNGYGTEDEEGEIEIGGAAAASGMAACRSWQ